MRRAFHAVAHAALILGCVGAAYASDAPAGVSSPAGLDGFVKVERLPVPDGPILAEGRQIWGESCQKCHGGNKATGAPKITSTKAWAPRIEQGIDTLFTHAIEGFTGPKFTMMPPKGGNDSLSDDAVRSAVAFMIWASGGEDAALAYSQSKDH